MGQSTKRKNWSYTTTKSQVRSNSTWLYQEISSSVTSIKTLYLFKVNKINICWMKREYKNIFILHTQNTYKQTHYEYCSPPSHQKKEAHKNAHIFIHG
mmetsp:Transcript_28953/g.42677  ORF Transcript_28953/g.42677 Transcript_28953/m.42677 type:complete len:98 (-) Transcript_28953:61-354(-)